MVKKQVKAKDQATTDVGEDSELDKEDDEADRERYQGDDNAMALRKTLRSMSDRDDMKRFGTNNKRTARHLRDAEMQRFLDSGEFDKAMQGK